MRILLVALMVALVACTASAAPMPAPTVTAGDDELKNCVAAIVKEFGRIAAHDSFGTRPYSPRHNPFMVQDADLEAQCARYLE